MLTAAQRALSTASSVASTVAANNVTKHVHSRQRHGTTFFYRVRATNAAGDSAYSNVASATTLGW